MVAPIKMAAVVGAMCNKSSAIGAIWEWIEILYI